MEGINSGKLLKILWKEYRFVILILFAGLFLMLLPSRQSTSTATGSPEGGQSEAIVLQEEGFSNLEKRLERILSNLQGAGKVCVLLTEFRGEEYLYQIDAELSSSESKRESTVILTNENRGEEGLIRRIDPPEYMGAVVLSQGADDPSVRLEISQAVSSATGLPMNRITILKMK